MKRIVTAIVLMTSFLGFAQVDMSSYKYVVVPKQFSIFKRVNQHNTSTLIKHLFTQKGFVTVYDDSSMPNELFNDRCLGLHVDLIDDSSMFTTKTILVLNDCNNQEVLISQQGRSKKKEYEASFKEAILEAFNSFVGLEYSYKPSNVGPTDDSVTISFKNDIKTVDDSEGVSDRKEVMVEQKSSIEEQSYKDKTPQDSNYKKAVGKVVQMKKQVATKEEQSFEDRSPIATNYTKENSESEKVIKIQSPARTGILYAQQLQNGFQLVDSTPKIRLKMYKSSMPNVYVASAEDKDGVVYTSDGKWFFEYAENGSIIKEELNIKF